jgi:cobalt-zinc-cadmium efflux system membrane fusion protein
MSAATRSLRSTLPLLLLVASACGRADAPAQESHEPEQHGHAEDEEHAESRPLALTPEQHARYGIAVAAAAPGPIDSGHELLGEVRANGDRLAHIEPRFPGIVKDVRRSAGDAVRAGDVLAVIESSESLVHYELRTLLDGVVIEKHLTLGEAVDRDDQAFVVADLSTVWVELSLYQKDFGRVRPGLGVRVQAVTGGAAAEGVVSYVAPAIDPETRTATARVVLANPERVWRPGMFVTARTLDPQPAEVLVPSDAVQILGGQRVVFVETNAGFAPRAVTIGREGASLLEIASGLAAGERVATGNTFLLKAELTKGAAGHDH